MTQRADSTMWTGKRSQMWLVAAMCGGLMLGSSAILAEEPAKPAVEKKAEPADKKPESAENKRPELAKPGKRLEAKVTDGKTAVGAPGAPAAPAVPLDPNAPKPIIKPDEETHDFGTTWVGDPLKHTFKIKNEGVTVLEITKVQPGCGCTVAGPHPNKLEPGETGDFSFTMNSAKLHGPYEKMITVSSNDPANPQLKLKLKGDVKQYVTITPNSANFGKVFGSEPQERVLKITNNTEKPLELKFESPKDSKFKFDLVETEKGKAYDLKVSLSATDQPGNLNQQVQLTTNVDAQKTLDINAIATIPPRLDIQPAEVTVIDPAGPKAADPGTGLTRLVRFTNYGGTPVKVTEATVDDPDVKVSVQERQADKEYTITVQMPAGYKPPEAGRMITLKTTDEKQPTVTVPIKSPAKTVDKTQPSLSPAELMIGTQAPAFGFKTVDGKSVTNVELANTVAVLDFWAPNCGYCKKQLPRIEPIRKEFESKGVRFFGMTQKMRKDFTQEEITKVFREDGQSGMELVLDLDNQVGGLFKANSYPTMILVGKTGKVEAVNSGNIGDLESKLTQQLTDLLAGKSLPKPDPKAATAQQPPARPATELVGKPAPEFAIKTIAGKDAGKADFGNHPATILNFVAPNCGYCKKQVPILEGLRKDYEAKGVRFVNVVEKFGNKEFTQQEIEDVFKGTGSQLEMALDLTNTVGGQYKAQSFPTMVVVNKKGEVEQVHIGAKPDLDATLKAQLDAMIAGKPSSTAAVPAPKAPAGGPTDAARAMPVEVKPITKEELEKRKKE